MEPCKSATVRILQLPIQVLSKHYRNIKDSSLATFIVVLEVVVLVLGESLGLPEPRVGVEERSPAASVEPCSDVIAYFKVKFP